MRKKSFFLGLVGVTCIVVGTTASGCGSSTAGTDGGTDGGTDSGHPGKDGGGMESSMSCSSDAEGNLKDGACPALDAAAAMIMFTPACGACVDQNCCSVAQICASNPACIAIIKCQLACIADGGSGIACATSCVDASNDDCAKGQAQNFDQCLVASCSTSCVAAKM
jgi:hypothetical protein